MSSPVLSARLRVGPGGLGLGGPGRRLGGTRRLDVAVPRCWGPSRCLRHWRWFAVTVTWSLIGPGFEGGLDHVDPLVDGVEVFPYPQDGAVTEVYGAAAG